ncbi:7-alpha-hydroxycholest-4-en-3-one 12-alpha-hydroxylase [Fukomys damarensis]|uniref:7-alpha-hydroxycholest-4-en-3-one 12-alpha-hydroxylase n=1 Tax=Fukomys damarensis TaxID=885580 RepID=A0A091ED76_FUKDA|nr:7-alpha-hydroxycholest-4-en-3-one 12-alpha-hydroxylase [Fukomys damarensis]KFO33291.1 7-alpha-hydroxycholest-4-en-3-one 12-alpha-hydroxylase [Fukomys damarensis]
MVIWGLVLGAMLVAIVAYLCLPGLLRQRRPQEPPLDKGCIPWVGHAMAFQKNMFEFLRGKWAKDGDVFTVLLGGEFFTFVMDPLSFRPIIKNTEKKLDFVQYAEEVVQKVYGYQRLQGDYQIIHTASTKYLMGDGLKDLNQAVLDCLSLVLLEPGDPKLGATHWQEDGLFHFCYNIMFKAGYLSLFGCTKDKEQDLLQAEEVFKKFRRFDILLPRFLYSLLGPRERLEMGQLQCLFHKMLSVRHNQEKEEGMSNWLRHMLRYLSEWGTTPAVLAKFSFMMLWASQGNMGPSSFWALLFLLKHPEAMQAVKDEAAQVLRGTKLEAKQSFVLPISALGRTPVLDSVMEETLRLAAAPTLVRVVQEDCTLKMASGHEYLLRRGDRVALFPYLSVHMDPDIHPEPCTFKFDRFLNPNGSRKVDFYKKGKKIHHYSMPWGSGVSICPGRFLALSEMKLFVLLMVTYFDLELVEPDTPVPPIDPGRWGFGITQPSHEVHFRYRLKPMD